ncbi:hypothetical protein SESBI_46577, partial [Sesbania bispinosa]
MAVPIVFTVCPCSVSVAARPLAVKSFVSPQLKEVSPKTPKFPAAGQSSLTRCQPAVA